MLRIPGDLYSTLWEGDPASQLAWQSPRACPWLRSGHQWGPLSLSEGTQLGHSITWPPGYRTTLPSGTEMLLSCKAKFSGFTSRFQKIVLKARNVSIKLSWTWKSSSPSSKQQRTALRFGFLLVCCLLRDSTVKKQGERPLHCVWNSQEKVV